MSCLSCASNSGFLLASGGASPLALLFGLVMTPIAVLYPGEDTKEAWAQGLVIVLVVGIAALLSCRKRKRAREVVWDVILAYVLMTALTNVCLARIHVS